jgi:DNA polymerase-3 subunit epsilon
MGLKLSRPICFYDLETTGINVSSDRIVSISVLKMNVDGSTEGKSTLVNPTILIPKAASDVHGILDEHVAEMPTFKQISKALYGFFKDSDIAGYNNNNFDNALLYEEFLRCGIEYPTPDVKSVDVINIFKKMESRTLSYAYKFYCGKDLDDAHTSESDTAACREIFLAQIEKYPELLDKEVDFYCEFSKVDNRVDFAGKIVKDEKGDLRYNFGKAKDKKISEDTGFGEWMLKQNFITENTKNVVRFELNRLINK